MRFKNTDTVFFHCEALRCSKAAYRDSNFLAFGFLLLAFYLSPHFIYSQTKSPQQYSFIHLNEENSSLDNYIIDAADDTHGYIWIISSSGFYRFDGRNYKKIKYPADQNDRFSLYKNLQGEVLLYDITINTFYRIDERGAYTKIPQMKAGFNCFLAETGQVIDFGDFPPERNNQLQKLVDEKVKGFYQVDSVGFYLSVDAGMIYTDKNTTVSIRVPAIQNKIKLIRNGLLFLMDEKEGYTYMFDKGVLLYKKKMRRTAEQSSSQVLFSGSAKLFPVHYRSFCCAEDKLYEVVLGKDSLPELSLLTFDKSIKNISQLKFHSKYNFYYITTNTDGLYLMFPKQFTTIYDNKYRMDDVFVQAELMDGTLYTPDWLLDKSGKISNVQLVDSALKLGLYCDQQNNIWGSTPTAVFKYNYSTKELKKYPLGEPVVCFDPHGDTLWLCTSNRIAYLLNDKVVFIKDVEPKIPNIKHFVKNKQLLWISTENGLYRYDMKTSKLTEVNELKGKCLLSACILTDGSILFALSRDRPYYYFKEKFYPLPLDAAGNLAISYCFLQDKNGSIWVSTSRGLFQLKKQDLDEYVENKNERLYCYYYEKRYGFICNEFNGGCNPSGIIKHNGDISFPSYQGFVWYSPYSVSPVLPYLPVLIDCVELDSLILDPAAEIKIPPDFGHLQVEISLPYFYHSNNLSIEYSLDKTGENWYPVAADGKITINTLPCGDYELRIRKINGFGKNNFSYCTVQFTVLPGWYQKPVARLLFIILLVALIYGVYRMRVQKLISRQKTLDYLVDQKTSELNSAIAQLKQSVSDLKISEDMLYKSNQQKERLTSVLAHDLRSPLKFMTRVSDFIYKNIGKEKNEEVKKLALDLKNSSQSILAFTEEFLAWFKSEKENFKVRPAQLSVGELYREMLEFYADSIKINNNVLQIDLKNEITVVSDVRLLKIIIRNLVDNANKYTSDGKVVISASEVEEHILLSVRDNGRGMSAEQINSILKEENDFGLALEIKDQLGFIIIKDFVAKLGGQIFIQSEAGKGTEIKIQIPKLLNG